MIIFEFGFIDKSFSTESTRISIRSLIVFGIWRTINCCYEKFRIRCLNFHPQTLELVAKEGYLLYCPVVSTQNCNADTCSIFPILTKYGKTLWTNKMIHASILKPGFRDTANINVFTFQIRIQSSTCVGFGNRSCS